MRDLITSLITIIIAIIFAWAGSQGTPDLFGFPGLIFLTALSLKLKIIFRHLCAL